MGRTHYLRTGLQGCHNSLALAKLFDAAISHQQQFIDKGEKRWPVRDDDDSRSTPFGCGEGRHYGSLTFRVEIGVGFVEYDVLWVPEHCTGESDTLLLSARQERSAFSNLRIVPFG